MNEVKSMNQVKGANKKLIFPFWTIPFVKVMIIHVLSFV
jgi:hypothetical protein